MSESPSLAPSALGGRRIALVVGVREASKSQDIPIIKYPLKDAVDIDEVLRKYCEFEVQKLLTDQKATSGEIKSEVLKLIRDPQEDDFLLFYFSGHGVPIGEDLYLATYDFNEDEARQAGRDVALPLSLLWDYFVPSNAGSVLLILDCCYAGKWAEAGPNPQLEKLVRDFAKAINDRGVQKRGLRGAMRQTLMATTHHQTAGEADGHGKLTGLLLPALRGEVGEAKDPKGNVTVGLVNEYLKRNLGPQQTPGLYTHDGNEITVLARFPISTPPQDTLPALSPPKRPNTYRPLDLSDHFQERADVIAFLKRELIGSEKEQQVPPSRRVGLVGIRGSGKTQLAVQFAYLSEHDFPDGIFWMTATGKSKEDWQAHLAFLARETEYLRPNDDPSNPENEIRRAQHFLKYLVKNPRSLLILDNVEDPPQMLLQLRALAGEELDCAILYTSLYRDAPNSFTTYEVEGLKESAAYHLLLEGIRPQLLVEIMQGSQSIEAQASRALCREVGYLPLALVHLYGLLKQDSALSVARLLRAVQEKGALEVTEHSQNADPKLTAIFEFTWELIKDDSSKRLFKLAGFFPEAEPIPLWLLGVAAGLGEHSEPWEPLGEAWYELYNLSLLEDASDHKQAYLHPLLREFSQRLVEKEVDQGKGLKQEAGERLAMELAEPARFAYRQDETRDYWQCLEDVHAGYTYARALDLEQAERLAQVERWLRQDGDLLRDASLWPQRLPDLLYQQLHNHTVEVGRPTTELSMPAQWIRQLKPVGKAKHSPILSFPGHGKAVVSVAFSPDGTTFLTGSEDGTARLWEGATGKLLRTFADPQQYRVTCVAFSPEGKRIIVGSLDNQIWLWDVETNKLLRIFSGHGEPVTSVAFSPNGNMILTGSADKTARLWDITSKDLDARIFVHPKRVTSVAFSPDGESILTGAAGGAVELWDVASGRSIRKFRDHRSDITRVTFSPDGSRVLSCAADGTVKLWTKAGRTQPTNFVGHRQTVWSAVFSTDGTTILTGSADQTARRWQASDGKSLGVFALQQNDVRSITFSSKGMGVLCGDSAGTIRLWGSIPWESVSANQLDQGKRTSAAFSLDGKQVVIGDENGEVRMWDIVTGSLSAESLTPQEEVTSVAFSPDGSKVLIGNKMGRARLWNAAGGIGWRTVSEHPSSVRSVAFSPDGSYILTGSHDRRARLWDLSTGDLVVTFEGHTAWVESVAFSPDGHQVLTGAHDQTARLWETVSGKRLAIFKGLKSAVSSVAFSPQGDRILAGSGGQAVLWKAASEERIFTFPGRGDTTSKVAFSPDGRLVLLCDGTGLVWLWDADSKQEKLWGIYAVNDEIGAVYWPTSDKVILVGLGGANPQPYLYQLKIEGINGDLSAHAREI